MIWIQILTQLTESVRLCGCVCVHMCIPKWVQKFKPRLCTSVRALLVIIVLMQLHFRIWHTDPRHVAGKPHTGPANKGCESHSFSRTDGHLPDTNLLPGKHNDATPHIFTFYPILLTSQLVLYNAYITVNWASHTHHWSHSTVLLLILRFLYYTCTIEAFL